MREINRDLLLQLNEAQVFSTSLMKEHTNSSFFDQRGLSPMKSTTTDAATLSTARKYEDASKVHSLYQELFVNDLQRDLESVESRAQSHKERFVEAQMDVTSLKRQNAQYQMIMKRYKKLVAELNDKIRELQNRQGMGAKQASKSGSISLSH